MPTKSVRKLTPQEEQLDAQLLARRNQERRVSARAHDELLDNMHPNRCYACDGWGIGKDNFQCAECCGTGIYN